MGATPGTEREEEEIIEASEGCRRSRAHKIAKKGKKPQ